MNISLEQGAGARDPVRASVGPLPPRRRLGITPNPTPISINFNFNPRLRAECGVLT